jgi:hypothetical protein
MGAHSIRHENKVEADTIVRPDGVVAVCHPSLITIVRQELDRPVQFALRANENGEIASACMWKSGDGLAQLTDLASEEQQPSSTTVDIGLKKLMLMDHALGRQWFASIECHPW